MTSVWLVSSVCSVYYRLLGIHSRNLSRPVGQPAVGHSTVYRRTTYRGMTCYGITYHGITCHQMIYHRIIYHTATLPQNNLPWGRPWPLWINLLATWTVIQVNFTLIYPMSVESGPLPDLASWSRTGYDSLERVTDGRPCASATPCHDKPQISQYTAEGVLYRTV